MVAEFDVEKVIFPEREVELSGCPFKELQELIVRKEVPVTPDDGEGDAFALQVC